MHQPPTRRPSFRSLRYKSLCKKGIKENLRHTTKFQFLSFFKLTWVAVGINKEFLVIHHIHTGGRRDRDYCAYHKIYLGCLTDQTSFKEFLMKPNPSKTVKKYPFDPQPPPPPQTFRTPGALPMDCRLFSHHTHLNWLG